MIVGTESWIREEINIAEVFRVDTQHLGEISVLEAVECSFVLKTTSIARSYGRMAVLR